MTARNPNSCNNNTKKSQFATMQREAHKHGGLHFVLADNLQQCLENGKVSKTIGSLMLLALQKHFLRYNDVIKLYFLIKVIS